MLLPRLFSSLATFARTQLEAILDDGFFSENEQSELIAILKDLSFYHYGKIVISSMHLMNQYFSATSTLFDQTIQAQVLSTSYIRYKR